MRVFIATPLRSYTGAAEVEATGNSVCELLADLERRFPGLRFRMVDEQGKIRPHMRVFVNGEQSLSLDAKTQPEDEIHILQALSGG
jgi:molybdopterin synthase sulfur carrier subunit